MLIDFGYACCATRGLKGLVLTLILTLALTLALALTLTLAAPLALTLTPGLKGLAGSPEYAAPEVLKLGLGLVLA